MKRIIAPYDGMYKDFKNLNTTSSFSIKALHTFVIAFFKKLLKDWLSLYRLRELVRENLELYEIVEWHNDKKDTERNIYKCRGFVELVRPKIMYKGDKDKFAIKFYIYDKDVTTIKDEEKYKTYYKIDTIRTIISIYEETIKFEDE